MLSALGYVERSEICQKSVAQPAYLTFCGEGRGNGLDGSSYVAKKKRKKETVSLWDGWGHEHMTTPTWNEFLVKSAQPKHERGKCIDSWSSNGPGFQKAQKAPC